VPGRPAAHHSGRIPDGYTRQLYPARPLRVIVATAAGFALQIETSVYIYVTVARDAKRRAG
jgi:hypothetical protein